MASDDEQAHPPALDPEFVESLRKRGVLGQVAALFQTRESTRIRDMRAALAQRDYRRLAVLVHPLTGNAGAVGAFHLGDLSSKLEQRALDGAFEACVETLDSIEEEFARAIAELETSHGS